MDNQKSIGRRLGESKAIGRGTPIIDASMRIVGWTLDAPLIRGAELRHREAESLVGGPIDAVYVQLHNLEDAIAAGAPVDWKGPWRCLALADARVSPVLGRTDSSLSASSSLPDLR